MVYTQVFQRYKGVNLIWSVIITYIFYVDILPLVTIDKSSPRS